MSEVRIGGVTARFNEDGTLYLYQPDSNRLLSAELADQLVQFLMLHGLRLETVKENLTPLADVAAEFGVDLTGLSETELEADKNAAEARASQALDALTQDAEVSNLAAMREEFGPEVQSPAEPTLKQLRAQATKAGVSPAGSKAQITARLAKHGH